jgi:hypothetical protein
LRLATVDAHDTVHFRSVSILRDLGNAVDIGTGLADTDRVIDTPPDGLSEGDRVEVSQPGAKDASHG